MATDHRLETSLPVSDDIMSYERMLSTQEPPPVDGLVDMEKQRIHTGTDVVSSPLQEDRKHVP